MQSMDMKTFMNDFREVSAGDSVTDHARWIIECPNGKKGDTLQVETVFVLKNYLSGLPFAANRQYVFDVNSCGQVCPIMGHLEPFCGNVDDNSSQLKVVSGLFINA
jgi:hypothetical protein